MTLCSSSVYRTQTVNATIRSERRGLRKAIADAAADRAVPDIVKRITRIERRRHGRARDALAELKRDGDHEGRQGRRPKVDRFRTPASTKPEPSRRTRSRVAVLLLRFHRLE